MTSTGTILAGTASPAPSSAWRLELAETLKLSWPMALSQLGQVAMMTSDLALIGRLGDHVVAAAALAHMILFTAFVLGMGLVSAVAPLAAQAFGARQPRMVRRAVRVGLWASVLLGIPLTVAQLYGHDILMVLGQTEEAATLAAQYLYGLAWCMVPGWCFIALRGFMGAVNRPEPALWITLAAIPANVVLAYALIYGAFGLPRLELLGAGLATTIVYLGMCIAAIWVCYTRRPFRKYQVLGRFWRPDWPLLGKLVAIGGPMSGTFLLEYGLFGGAAILMGWLGTAALAAHNIALTTASVMFMVPFGISMAATVRVGQAVGRRDAPGTRTAGFVAIGLGVIFMVAMTVLVGIFRHDIPPLFLGADTADSAATAELAATLLLMGASFFVADGIQTVAAGSLRGLNDTRVPLIFSAVCFWLVGFTCSYGLAFPMQLGAVGVWIGFTIGLVLYAFLLVLRFHILTRRGFMPTVSTPG